MAPIAIRMRSDVPVAAECRGGGRRRRFYWNAVRRPASACRSGRACNLSARTTATCRAVRPPPRFRPCPTFGNGSSSSALPLPVRKFVRSPPASVDVWHQNHFPNGIALRRRVARFDLHGASHVDLLNIGRDLQSFALRAGRQPQDGAERPKLIAQCGRRRARNGKYGYS